MRGYPTTWGAGGFEQQTFEEDAAVVQRLDAAGAVLVAKLTLGALAMGTNGSAGDTQSVESEPGIERVVCRVQPRRRRDAWVSRSDRRRWGRSRRRLRDAAIGAAADIRTLCRALAPWP